MSDTIKTELDSALQELSDLLDAVGGCFYGFRQAAGASWAGRDS